jgi:hypothetical protein
MEAGGVSVRIETPGECVVHEHEPVNTLRYPEHKTHKVWSPTTGAYLGERCWRCNKEWRVKS